MSSLCTIADERAVMLRLTVVSDYGTSRGQTLLLSVGDPANTERGLPFAQINLYFVHTYGGILTFYELYSNMTLLSSMGKRGEIGSKHGAVIAAPTRQLELCVQLLHFQ